MDTAERMTKAKNAIMRETNGNPYSMHDMLSNCSSLDDLEEYEEEDNWRMRRDCSFALSRYYPWFNILVSALVEGSCIDLTAPVDGLGTLETLADLAYIRKEGSVTSAKLYATNYVQAELVLAVSQLKKFLSDWKFGRGIYREDYDSSIDSEDDDSSESM